MIKLPVLSLVVALACCASPADADSPQSLSATVNGARFSGDDDTILFVPLDSGEFTLSASTAGAASYPPPKTPIDRLSIVCRGYVPGKPLQIGKNEFSPDICYATYTLGTNDEHFTLDKDNAANRFEITTNQARLIEGSFELHMTSAGGNVMTISEGRFVAEDRQM